MIVLHARVINVKGLRKVATPCCATRKLRVHTGCGVGPQEHDGSFFFFSLPAFFSFFFFRWGVRSGGFRVLADDLLGLRFPPQPVSDPQPQRWGVIGNQGQVELRNRVYRKAGDAPRSLSLLHPTTVFFF